MQLNEIKLGWATDFKAAKEKKILQGRLNEIKSIKKKDVFRDVTEISTYNMHRI